MKKLIDKFEIAHAQIEKACELHLKGGYSCSLTLAGSAESLTHELANARGSQSVDFWYIKFIRVWRQRFGSSTPPQIEKYLKKIIVRGIQLSITKEVSLKRSKLI